MQLAGFVSAVLRTIYPMAFFSQRSSATTVARKTFQDVVRLGNVPGDGDKSNDVIMGGDVLSATKHVIFFGGDIQDYVERMESHRDNWRYAHWNLERTCEILMKRFPGAAVFIVKPHHMHLLTFSIYSNFVHFDGVGCPNHSADFGAWRHLQKLRASAIEIAVQMKDNMSSASSGPTPQDCPCNSEQQQQCSDLLQKPIQVIGFSKGCVVLNQLVFEMKSVVHDPDLLKFASQVEDFFWLDGGHCGGKDTWVTKEKDLVDLANLSPNIHVYVTPYQMKDSMRKWIGREERQFVDRLKKMKAKIKETRLFDNEPGSIERHLDVLTSF